MRLLTIAPIKHLKNDIINDKMIETEMISLMIRMT